SCQGATVTVDGAAAALELLPRGDGAVRVTAPARFTGKREMAVAAALGTAQATARIRLTGGPVARLTAAFSEPRVVADGRRAVVVVVAAHDQHGTPTAAANLRWHAPGGHL